ncbi:MAG: hypothetical protein U1E52_01430 [Geminicoccaceae bacterium]
MLPKSFLKLAALLVAVGILAGCGFKPMPVPDSSGIPPGPGLLTGKSGEWVILGRNPDPS